MNKIRFISLLTALTVLLAAVPLVAFADSSEPGLVWDFYYKSDFDEFRFVTVVDCDVEWANNALLMTSDAYIENNLDAYGEAIGDPSFTIGNAASCGLDCDKYQYVAVNLLNSGEATQFEGHFGTSLHPLDGESVFHFNMDAGMTSPKTFVFHMPTQNVLWTNLINAPGGIRDEEIGDPTAQHMEEGDSHWEGTLNMFRIDGPYYGGRSGLCPGDVPLEIVWIAFFETEEAALNYAGPDHTRATPEVTATPAPDLENIIPAGTVIFDGDYYDDFWRGGSLLEDYSYNEEDNCYDLFFTEGIDPFVIMSYDTYSESDEAYAVDLDEYKVMQLKVKIDPKAGRVGNIYYTTDEAPGAFAEAQNIQYNYTKTDDWQIVNVNGQYSLPWTGMLSATRFDVFSTLNTDTVVKIAYVAFFKTMADAEAFAANGSVFPATPEPTTPPTPTPSPEVTATPEITPTSEPVPTEEPTAEAKSESGCGGILTGSAAIVIAGAMLFLVKKKH